MRFVQVSYVPTSASPGELAELFGQAGKVDEVICQYEAGAAEGTALVAFASPAAAQEAADLLDGYPLGTSLLEVKAMGAHQFVGQLAARLLAPKDPGSGQPQQARQAQAQQAPPLPLLPQRRPVSAPIVAARAPVRAPPPPPPAVRGGGSAAAHSGGAVEALEAEMRELQLQLQAQADTIQETAAAAVAERQQREALQRQQQEELQRQQQQQGWGADDAYGYGGETVTEEGWQEAAPRARRPHAQQQQQAQEQWQRDHAAADAAASAGAGGGFGGGQFEEPNTGLWIGWIDMRVEAADLARAFSRWGPVQVEHLTPADRPADDGRRYKWGIVRYQNIDHAIAAKQDTDRRPLPAITSGPRGLKVVYYTPGRSGPRKR